MRVEDVTRFVYLSCLMLYLCTHRTISGHGVGLSAYVQLDKIEVDRNFILAAFAIIRVGSIGPESSLSSSTAAIA